MVEVNNQCDTKTVVCLFFSVKEMGGHIPGSKSHRIAGCLLLSGSVSEWSSHTEVPTNSLEGVIKQNINLLNKYINRPGNNEIVSLLRVNSTILGEEN